jgi:hypothetical protein
VIDDIASVPGKKRVFLKDASAIVNRKFRVKATNNFGATVTSDPFTIDVIAMVKIDYYQEQITYWKQEKVNADAA